MLGILTILAIISIINLICAIVIYSCWDYLHNYYFSIRHIVLAIPIFIFSPMILVVMGFKNIYDLFYDAIKRGW
jgi:multisubunit Na+/H+ antiporter MnhG subunit